MVYNSTYESGDFVGIFTDVLGEFGTQIIAYIGLIIIVAVVGFLIVKLKGR